MDHLSLFKPNHTPYWYIQYQTAEGIRKQKSTRCTQRADAVKVFSDFKRFLDDSSKPKRIAFSAYIKDFLAYAMGNFSATTVSVYELAFKHFLRIHGDLELHGITPRHWDLFKTIRLKEKKPLRRIFASVSEKKNAIEKQRPLSPVTVNIELKSLRAALATAVRWQLITKNPFERLPLVTIPRRTPSFLTVEQSITLLDTIPDGCFKDFVIFALNTGMRRGEILSLRFSNIDEDRRVARIINSDDFTTKTKEERVVALNDAALLAVKRRKAVTKEEYIFMRKGKYRLTPDYATKSFKKAIISAGLERALHLHSTRHSFASILVGKGTPLYSVSKLLGHSSTKTSEIYSHLLPQHLHDEVDKINLE
jgi:integrase